MPFVSDAQRKFMYANHPEIAKRWQKHTPKGKDLPEHVKKAIARIKHANGEGDEEEEETIPITEGKKVPLQALNTFFQTNPSPVDAQVHELAQAYGTDPHTMKTQIYSMLGSKMKTALDRIHGGKADGKSVNDFDPKQIAMGKKVEMEHTDNPEIAEEISTDHLEEFDKYYTALANMEDKLKQGKTASYAWGVRRALLHLV